MTTPRPFEVTEKPIEGETLEDQILDDFVSSELVNASTTRSHTVETISISLEVMEYLQPDGKLSQEGRRYVAHLIHVNPSFGRLFDLYLGNLQTRVLDRYTSGPER